MTTADELVAAARAARAGGMQHVDMRRKLSLRRTLLTAAADGAAYVPFCGTAEMAAELYDDRPVVGADWDSSKVLAASVRMPDALFVVADCNNWPFMNRPPASLVPGRTPRPLTVERSPLVLPDFAVADFDADGYPYDAFRAWWEHAPKTPTVVCAFTDRQLGLLARRGPWRNPNGTTESSEVLLERRKIANAWWTKTVLPWIHVVADDGGWKVRRTVFSIDAGRAIYWGAVLDHHG